MSPREVEKELLAAFALVCKYGGRRILACLFVLAIVIAELGEAVVVVRMFLYIFFPQQLQRDVLVRHLFLKVRQ